MPKTVSLGGVDFTVSDSAALSTVDPSGPETVDPSGPETVDPSGPEDVSNNGLRWDLVI
jgi:hypothetical protein